MQRGFDNLLPDQKQAVSWKASAMYEEALKANTVNPAERAMFINKTRNAIAGDHVLLQSAVKEFRAAQ